MVNGQGDADTGEMFTEAPRGWTGPSGCWRRTSNSKACRENHDARGYRRHSCRWRPRRGTTKIGGNVNRYWVMLLVAARLEIVWAVGLKYTQGLTRLWPSAGTILAMAASMYLLARAAEGLPIGTAYAVWTGIGAVGTATVGMFFLNEARDWVRLACIVLIILGVIGLKAFAREGVPPAAQAASRPAD